MNYVNSQVFRSQSKIHHIIIINHLEISSEPSSNGQHFMFTKNHNSHYHKSLPSLISFICPFISITVYLISFILKVWGHQSSNNHQKSTATRPQRGDLEAASGDSPVFFLDALRWWIDTSKMETEKPRKMVCMVWKYLGINVVLMILLYIYILFDGSMN